MTDPVDLIRALLAGEPGAGAALAPAVRGAAFGVEAFGAQDAAALVGRDPVTLSPRPHVVRTAQGLALVDADAQGRAVGVLADLYDGLIGRLWRVGAAREGLAEEDGEVATPVAFDPFLSQARDQPIFTEADLPELDAAGPSALALTVRRPELMTAYEARPMLVLRAFGGAGQAAALFAAAGPAASARHVLITFRYDAETLLHLQVVSDAEGPGPSASAFIGGRSDPPCD